MKKKYVLQKVNARRIVFGFPIKNLGTVLLFVLLLPYVITFLFGNLVSKQEEGLWNETWEELEEGSIQVVNHTAMGEERLPLELYVADKLARCMDADFEAEALKAQAVLIRTNLLKSSGEKPEIKVYDEEYAAMPIGEAIWQAVAQTAGVCLFYEGEPAYGAYFAISNGATRDGEALSEKDYPYLKSVPCEQDFLAQDFGSSDCLERETFEHIWAEIPACEIERDVLEPYAQSSGQDFEEMVCYRDRAGYVVYVEYKKKCVTGEDFRQGFRLASASFVVRRLEEQIILTVKGAGHGFGMSQFGANALAQNGESYVEILNYFFDGITITKIE